MIQALMTVDLVELLNKFLQDKPVKNLLIMTPSQVAEVNKILQDERKDKIKQYSQNLSGKKLHQLDKESWFVKIITYLCETRLYKYFPCPKPKVINNYIEQKKNFQTFIKKIKSLEVDPIIKS